MGEVIHRTNYRYVQSAHVFDYPSGVWLWDPDLSSVSGVAQKYWKVSSNSVVEMSQLEKDNIDKIISTDSAGFPNDRRMFGSLSDYPSASTISVNEIQYTQVWFARGEKISSFETFINVAKYTNDVRFGLYEQADTISRTGVPTNRLVQTSGAEINKAWDNSFVNVSLDVPFEIPYNGYYWIAHITDASKNKVASTLSYNPGVAPVRFESSSSLTLPPVANSTKQKSSVLYVATVMLEVIV